MPEYLWPDPDAWAGPNPDMGAVCAACAEFLWPEVVCSACGSDEAPEGWPDVGREHVWPEPGHAVCVDAEGEPGTWIPSVPQPVEPEAGQVCALCEANLRGDVE